MWLLWLQCGPFDIRLVYLTPFLTLWLQWGFHWVGLFDTWIHGCSGVRTGTCGRGSRRPGCWRRNWSTTCGGTTSTRSPCCSASWTSLISSVSVFPPIWWVPLSSFGPLFKKKSGAYVGILCAAWTFFCEFSLGWYQHNAYSVIAQTLNVPLFKTWSQCAVDILLGWSVLSIWTNLNSDTIER